MSEISNFIETASVASTNDMLTEMISTASPAEGFAVYTPCQTAGKGQRGNVWIAEPGSSITFSIVFYPCFLSPARSFLLSEAVALGVKDALEEHADRVEIKWPNDIFLHGRKLGGILIENSITADCIASSVVGVGLNINQAAFPPEAPIAISLRQATGRETAIRPLFARLVTAVRRRYAQLRTGDHAAIVADYHAALYCRIGQFAFEDSSGRFEAHIDHVSDDGRLHLTDAAGRSRAYTFKEVRFKSL